ncbi:MAG: glycosyltransferase, partial [Thermoanaerobaculia bacterium]
QGCRVTVVTSSAYELDRLPRRFRTVFLFRPSRIKRLLVRRGSVGGRRPFLNALRSARLRMLYGSLALRLLWRRPDVVHFQSVSYGRDLFLVRLVAGLGFPVVYTAHDLLPHDSNSPEEREALASLYRRVDRVIVHADANRAELLKEFQVGAERVEVVPHGSYDFLLPEGEIERVAARTRLGLPSSGRIVLFLGLIKRYKGLEVLVDAFRQIAGRLPDAKLLIVGGLFPNAAGYSFYRQLLDEIAGDPQVITIPEYVPVETVGLYLCAADVVALPYVKTYHSGVLLAAYAAGRPVVVTDTGGMPEVVEEGRTGFVVPTRDPEALGSALARILENAPRAAAMGERAGQLARTTYSWERIAVRTARLYRAVARARSVRGLGLRFRVVRTAPPAAAAENDGSGFADGREKRRQT